MDDRLLETEDLGINEAILWDFPTERCPHVIWLRPFLLLQDAKTAPIVRSANNQKWVAGVYKLISKYETDEEFLIIPIESLVAFAKDMGVEG